MRVVSIFLSLTYSVLISLFLLNLSSADDSITKVEQIDKKYINNQAGYEVIFHSVALLSNITLNGYKVSELSGLSWDQDENILYALSDNGYVLQLRPGFSEGRMVDVTLVSGFSLLDENGRVLKYKPSDSEGITIINGNNTVTGDSELLISFERIPRIIRYNTQGVHLGSVKLPDKLSDIRNYHAENKSLEAITIHPEFGIITGPEYPLNEINSRLITLYSLPGDEWQFPVHNPYYGGLVDLALMDDGSVLALERSYGGLLPGLEITLHRLNLAESTSSEIITFESGEKFLNENYEGITRHQGNSYFMISDDNNHPLNRTHLVYFSIKKIQQ